MDMRAVVGISIRTRWGAPLGHKELLAPILLWSYQRHLSVQRVSFHPRLRPPISDCVVYQLRTIRNISPLSSPLCLRQFFLARNSFLSLSASSAVVSKPFTSIPRDRGGGCTTTRNHLGPAFREATAEKSSRAMFSRRHDTFTGFPDGRHDLYHTVRIVVRANLPFEDVCSYRQYR